MQTVDMKLILLRAVKHGGFFFFLGGLEANDDDDSANLNSAGAGGFDMSQRGR